MNTNALVEKLKSAGEDYEFYPTTREMVKKIWDHCRNAAHDWEDRGELGDVLDIGCGTCNFKRWIEEFNAEAAKRDKDYSYRRCRTRIHNYYIIEKSRILLDQLDPDVVVLGTDFHEATLIDKPVNTIFCNPPYKEYEDWAARIITESACKSIYLVIPQRWKDSDKIKKALGTVKINRYIEKDLPAHERAIKVIGSADFLDAERAARAKVDILYINKEYTPKDAGFDKFFDETFQMRDEKHSNKWEEEKTELKAELLAGKNKVEILCNGYNSKQKQLFDHFKTICGMDAATLEAIGVHKDNVKKALKANFEGLKNLYWQAAFDCLEEITSRLTSGSRRAMLDRFILLKTVDFTPSNVYALIIWVIKNANRYGEDQMVELFKALSSKENVQNYVSNKRTFEKDDWRYKFHQGEISHYTLDYRIIATKYALPGEAGYAGWNSDRPVHNVFRAKIGDICTVANNLGFPPESIDIPAKYGEEGSVRTTINGKPAVLFKFRCYQNDNVHLKFNVEFMKALNVAAARKLGWIKDKADIAREFTPEMAEGAERYFDAFKCIALDAGARLLLPEPGTEPERPEPEIEAEPEVQVTTAASTEAEPDLFNNSAL